MRKVLALIVLGAVATVFAGTALATMGPGFKRAAWSLAERSDLNQDQAAGQLGQAMSSSRSSSFVPGVKAAGIYRPGPAVVTVRSGALTLDQDDCSKRLTPRERWPSNARDVHRVRNVGIVDLEFSVTFSTFRSGRRSDSSRYTFWLG